MQALARTQKVTSIDEVKTYAGMDRFVVLPEGYESKIGLWSLINAITDQENSRRFQHVALFNRTQNKFHLTVTESFLH